MRQLKALGDVPDRPLTLPPIAPAEDERMSLREKSGLMQNGHAIVVVNANADDTSFERRWHPDRFAEVIDAIARARPDAAFYLTGTASERRYVEGIARQCRTAKTVRNVAGDLSLGEFVALLEISSVVLTNDSGPVHLAAAMGTPVVGLYGPESPQFYGPLDGSVAFYAGLECSPCLNVYTAKKFVCPYNARCMDAINVPDVTSAVLKVLNHKVVHALVD
jgi:ADP-heptose:LPS heptosyltransferase